MARLIILIAVVGIGLILWQKIGKAKGDERKKNWFSGALPVVYLLY